MSESRYSAGGGRADGDSDTSQGASEASQPWFADGLRFSCTMCGNCCSGGRGSVKFEPHEAAAMAAQLQVSQDTFYDKYTRKSRGRQAADSPPLREVKCVSDRASTP
jgi:hypothetical protein